METLMTPTGNGTLAFIAHALRPDSKELPCLSSALINEALKARGRPSLEQEQGLEDLLWFTIQYDPFDVDGARPVDVDFHIIPTYARQFGALLGNGEAYTAVSRIAENEMERSVSVCRDVVIGWGALTKNATDHGKRFISRQPPLDGLISTNHGDAGTAALALMALQRCGIKTGETVAIMGASGVIGSALARTVGEICEPKKIVLIGREKSRDKLEHLCEEIRGTAPEVMVDTDYQTGAVKHGALVVFVCTIEMEFEPEHFPKCCLVLDITTPSACNPTKAWNTRKQIVFAAGCGLIPGRHLPHGFATLANGRIVDDVGAGGHYTMWGCFCDCLVQASLGLHEHVVGDITTKQVTRAMGWFERFDIEPQHPVVNGTVLGWDDVSILYNFLSLKRQ